METEEEIDDGMQEGPFREIDLKRCGGLCGGAYAVILV